jgi:hypothetical protein
LAGRPLLGWVLFQVFRPSLCQICFTQLVRVLGLRLLFWTSLASPNCSLLQISLMGLHFLVLSVDRALVFSYFSLPLPFQMGISSLIKFGRFHHFHSNQTCVCPQNSSQKMHSWTTLTTLARVNQHVPSKMDGMSTWETLFHWIHVWPQWLAML